jgi:hypothetical protein
MKTAAAIRPTIKNVLNIAENQPMAVKMSHTPRIAPRIFPIIRPMCLWHAPSVLWRAVVLAPTPLTGVGLSVFDAVLDAEMLARWATRGPGAT